MPGAGRLPQRLLRVAAGGRRHERGATRGCARRSAPSMRTRAAPMGCLHAELAAQGCRVSRKRIARLMREAGLAGVSRRRGTRTTRGDTSHRAAPDRVERHFQADAPNRLWVADITYVPTWAGFLYLAIVLDVFSRGSWDGRWRIICAPSAQRAEHGLGTAPTQAGVHHSAGSAVHFDRFWQTMSRDGGYSLDRSRGLL